VGIGIWEILILVVIVLIVFGGYKRLPALGRSAGTGVRKGGEKAKAVSGQVRKQAEGVDTAKIGESVGKGIREAREVRDSVKGIGGEPGSKPEQAPASQPDRDPATGPAAPERREGP